MQVFTDCLGRSWEFRLTTTGVRQLKEIGLDVAQMVTVVDRLPDILFGDSERLATGLYRLIKPDISTDDFGDGMDGPTLEKGGVALIRACIDFFPRSAVATAMRDRVEEALKEMDAKLVSLLTTSSIGAGNSRASAA